MILRVLRLHMCADCAAIAIVGEGAKILRSRLDILPTRGFRERAREKIGLVLPR